MREPGGVAQPADQVAPLLEVEGLTVDFPLGDGMIRSRRQHLRAVDDLTFTIERGETFALVGESGSGKSTTGRALLQLEEPTHGSVRFDGTDLTDLGRRDMRRNRRRMQMIFQDPSASLNGRMPIRDIVGEPMAVHHLAKGQHREQRVRELLELVGLRAEMADRYPHEFSGGQLQRVGIARALAVEPEFIVADEPISALDVSIQAQVVNLLEDLQGRLGLTYLFIAHDLAVVRHLSDRVAVMYLGRIVEIGDCQQIYEAPKHPYTRALLSAVPVPDPQVEATREPIILHGDMPSPVDPPSGCRFRTRCWKADQRCADETPEMVEQVPGQWAACHYPEPATAAGTEHVMVSKDGR